MQTSAEPVQHEFFKLLKAKDGGKAWDHFLEHYAGRIEQAVSFRIKDKETARDVLVYVLEAFNAGNMKRLRKFDENRAVFSTFITAITNNLIRDYFREVKGRLYIPSALKKSPKHLQRMYILYLCGHSYAEIFGTIGSEYPGAFSSMASFLDAMIPLTRLTANKKRREALRDRSNVHLDGEHSGSIDVLLGMSANPESVLTARDDQSADEELLRRIDRYIAKLPEDERLMFTYAYRDRRSHKEICALLHRKDVAKKLWMIRQNIRKEFGKEKYIP